MSSIIRFSVQKARLKCHLLSPTLPNSVILTFDQLICGSKSESKMATLICLQGCSSLSLHSCCSRWKCKVQRPGNALPLVLLWQTSLLKRDAGREREVGGKSRGGREEALRLCHSLWWKCSCKIHSWLGKTCLSHSFHRRQTKFYLATSCVLERSAYDVV